jgi:hypothetical protein
MSKNEYFSGQISAQNAHNFVNSWFLGFYTIADGRNTPETIIQLLQLVKNAQKKATFLKF